MKKNSTSTTTSRFKEMTSEGSRCRYCGHTHPPRKCPAFHKFCGICKLKGHFAQVCRRKSYVNIIKNHNINENLYDLNDNETLFCGMVDIVKNQKIDNDWYSEITINKSKVIKMKLDSGAQCNVLPIKTYKMLNLSAPIERCTTKLRNYSGIEIETLGKMSY